MLAHPVVEDGFVVVEDEAFLGVQLAEIGGDAEGGQRFGQPLFPLPKPNRVQVSVAHQVDALGGISGHRVVQC